MFSVYFQPRLAAAGAGPVAPGDVAQPRQGLPQEPAQRPRLNGAVGGRHLGAPRVPHGPGMRLKHYIPH